MSRQMWDDGDEEHYRWLPFTSQQSLPKNALFEETWTEPQRIKINAWKYTPNSNVISFSGLLQLLKQHLERACCQCTETELISLSLQDARGMKMAGSVWKEFCIYLRLKSFQIPSSFTFCPSALTCVQNTFSIYLLLLL